jgi:CheY-like chemotaxis protein
MLRKTRFRQVPLEVAKGVLKDEIKLAEENMEPDQETNLASTTLIRTEAGPMRVTVLLADDAAIVRRAIRNLLSEREDIKIVGEAGTFTETIQKATELQPDEIIFDLRMAEGANGLLPIGPKVLAISFANDDEAKALAETIGAAKLLDKVELANELIPAILELTPVGSRPA